MTKNYMSRCLSLEASGEQTIGLDCGCPCRSLLALQVGRRNVTGLVRGNRLRPVEAVYWA